MKRILNSFLNSTIKAKLMKLQLVGASIVLLICTSLYLVNDLFIFKRSVEGKLASTAEILGSNLIPTLAFNDKAEAKKILSSLGSLHSIGAASVFDGHGVLFSNFGSEDLIPRNFQPIAKQASTTWQGRHITYTFKLTQENETVGYIFFDADLAVFATEYSSYPWIMLSVFLGCLFISYVVARVMHRTLSEPVVSLANTAKNISASGNYALRMKSISSEDHIEEYDTLLAEFNHMLDQIQAKDQAIQSANSELERKVEERTSELASAQSLLFQSEKMSALGEMAAGVAHEINNPLAIIKTNSEILSELLREDPLDRPAIEKMSITIETMVKRISKIVNSMRSFSRDSGQDAFEVVSVKSIIDETLVLCKERMQNFGVILKQTEVSPTIMLECRATQVSQIILNLLNNALDAIQQNPDKWIQLDVLDHGDRVDLIVTDSGLGISKEIIKKIFQPFFTTKEVGKGTGLGLSISKGIVESYKGTFSVNEKCKNTQFIVSLPKKRASV